MDLPEFLSPPLEQEARDLGIESVLFDPIDDDADQRAEDEAPLRAYALLDASQSAEIPVCLEAFSDPAICLFDGRAKEDLEDVAPWLVELTRHCDAFDWFLADGYGNNWGITIHSRLPLNRLKTQLKKFIKVEDETGELYFFKYYRPEHLNTYLPVFDADQLSRFMRGIEAVFAEDTDDPSRLIRHSQTKRGRYNEDAIDLMKRGEPLVIQPPSDDDVAAIIAQADAADPFKP
ncbi:DUF4123 domain-containing protein [Actibacterium sp. 188UL27-1]|uniref:DUF4123 domain-containing protein n=1 Tax=Actibacterium sp. 188UL27-1 TaxID=2786961 RepID=UPI00195EDCF7|nr:DUF4123 domain-containing protein [Actibacterium sp. 188UL27-1]MBM7069279.1 DUF4123 domain-containing protein [Actibacterium sp. 188UL27-1]